MLSPPRLLRLVTEAGDEGKVIEQYVLWAVTEAAKLLCFLAVGYVCGCLIAGLRNGKRW